MFSPSVTISEIGNKVFLKISHKTDMQTFYREKKLRNTLLPYLLNFLFPIIS